MKGGVKERKEVRGGENKSQAIWREVLQGLGRAGGKEGKASSDYDQD